MIEKNSHDDPRRGFFNELAAGWDDEEPSAETMVAGLAARAELLNLQPDQDLLEVGCGTGKTTAWLAGQVAPGRVTAVDFAPEMIAQARAKGIDADFACLDVCAAPPGKRYDIVLCFHSFPHFRDQALALRHLADSLTTGGRLIVMHMAGSAHINAFHATLEGPVNGDVLPMGDQWHALLHQAGLRQSLLIDRDDLFFLDCVRHADGIA